MAIPEALVLLRIARRDLRAAVLLQNPAADEANWGFQIQQAVEKALKAWLFGRITDRGGLVEPFLALEAFTAFAVQFRYDAEPEQMNLDRQHWHQQAEVLVDHVAAICDAMS